MPPAPVAPPIPALLVRLLTAGAISLLLAAWLLGGVVKDSTSQDEWMQLLALPVLATAVLALLYELPGDRWLRFGILVMVFAALLPLAQLLPLPRVLWIGADARSSLAADLAIAGVAEGQRWSLTPHDTETAFWAYMPALAAFLAGCALPRRSRWLVLVTCVALVLANVLFAVFQTGLPPDSAMRLFPYPDGVSIFGGLFINQNHHATALILGMSLALGLTIDAWRRSGRLFALPVVLSGSAALSCLCALPLTSSRAGMALALPALVGVLVLGGVFPLDSIRRDRRATAVAAAMVLLVAIGAWSALRWLAISKGQDPRFIIADATFTLGWDYFPWGSGIGSFTQVFESELPRSLWMPNFVNHAHNEYAQLWLTGGLPAMGLLLLAGAVFVATGLRILRAGGRSNGAVVAAACWVAIAAALVHSWVDFPLSTTSLMTMTAMLAGLMLRAIAGSGEAARWPVRAQSIRGAGLDAA